MSINMSGCIYTPPMNSFVLFNNHIITVLISKDNQLLQSLLKGIVVPNVVSTLKSGSLIEIIAMGNFL